MNSQQSLVRPIPLLLVSLLYSALFVLTFHSRIDDAYISFRFADNWAAGKGLVFNPGTAPVEGYSNFLWTALLALQALVIGLPTPHAALGLAYAAGLWTLGITYSAAPLFNLPTPKARTLPALLLAVNPSFVALAQMGLETVFFSALVAAGILRWLRERVTPGTRPRAWLWLLAAAVTRPEGILLSLGVLVYEALWPGVRHRRGRWWLLTAAGILIPLVVYHLCRYAYYGQWLPNPFYAKVPLGHWETIQRGLRYCAGFLLTHDGLYHSVRPLRLGFKWLVLIPALWACRHDRRGMAMPLALTILGYTAFIVVVGGDWMPYHRFFGHILPLLMLLAASGLVALWRGAAANRCGRLSVAGLAACVLLGQVGEGTASDLSLGPNWRRDLSAAVGRPFTSWRDSWTRLWRVPSGPRNGIRWVEEQYPDAHTASVDAVGLLPYYSKYTFYDTLGLVDGEIAQFLHRGDPQGAAMAVLAREPDLLFHDLVIPVGHRGRVGVTQVDRHILASETYATHYQLVRVYRSQAQSTYLPLIGYVTISVRRPIPLDAPGDPFQDQLRAHLATRGALLFPNDE